jgi:hypothetical protein
MVYRLLEYMLKCRMNNRKVFEEKDKDQEL